MMSREERQHNYHNIFKPLIIVTAFWQFSYLGNFYSSQTHWLTQTTKQAMLLWMGRRCPYNANYLRISISLEWQPIFDLIHCNIFLICLCFVPSTYWHPAHRDLFTSFLKLKTVYLHILPKISYSMFLILIRLFILIERPR